MSTRPSDLGRGRISSPVAGAETSETHTTDVRIHAAIVYEPGSASIAREVSAVLANTKGFSCAGYPYPAAPAGKRHLSDGTVPIDPHLVIAAIDDRTDNALRRLFGWIAENFPERPIIAVPTAPDAEYIYRALEAGAADFILPPLRASDLIPRLRRQARTAARENPVFTNLKADIGLKQIIGESPLLMTEIARVRRFARCDASVLISGESGTGKEVFARALHYLSPRAEEPFIAINCAALPEQLVESEIFGHKRGAFTGAASDQAGLIAEAEGGTLFLDEIDGLSPHAQVKLLRFLENGEYRPVGEQKLSRANIRVIAAANADFAALVRDGRFREDLFYRVNVLALTLPPLRERRGDIILLARHFLERDAAVAATRPKRLSIAALNALLGHSWPGNVRELRNVLIRATVLTDSDTIEMCDLGIGFATRTNEDESFHDAKSRVVSRFERDFLESALHAHSGNITGAARAVKKNRRAFWELLRKHGLLAGAKDEEHLPGHGRD
jgi:DNA-binding NtrC family response regulator